MDNLIQLILDKGPGCLLYNFDLSRAYRQLFIATGEIHLLGYKWRNLFYFDAVLQIGLRSAAYCCQRVTIISFIFSTIGLVVLNYLDDFAEAEEGDVALDTFYLFRRLLSDLGLAESIEKACLPNSVMTF